MSIGLFLVVEPSAMIVDAIRYYSILPMCTYNIMTLVILAMGLTLLIRRFGRAGGTVGPVADQPR